MHRHENIVNSVRWAAEHRDGAVAVDDEAMSQTAPATDEEVSALTTADIEAGATAPLVRAGNPIGRMLRKDAPASCAGQGHYLDDIQLPGMLWPPAQPHARRITSIDTSAAEAHPKVKAVIYSAVLETLGLAWMPTLSNDVQAVLATDKVRFKGQEVAFVIAEDRYAARDALELIEVDYEPLDPVVDARRALDEGSVMRRPRGQDRQPHLRLGVGRRRDGCSRRPTSWWPRTCSTPARTLRRSRRAARWPTWTR